ncbi:hypothetical protein BDQ17DRAFT_1333541 [Cyathus striatus]|nr:hypothetical protein BDQ17DRAFT_1333541 [Cyathus striatus]
MPPTVFVTSMPVTSNIISFFIDNFLDPCRRLVELKYAESLFEAMLLEAVHWLVLLMPTQRRDQKVVLPTFYLILLSMLLSAFYRQYMNVRGVGYCYVMGIEWAVQEYVNEVLQDRGWFPAV